MAMAAAKIQLQDDDFDNLNYGYWSSDAKAKLVSRGVWDVVVNGVPLDPTKVPESAATINAVNLAQWRNLAIKDMKALKILQSSLPSSIYRKTISVASAKDLWDLLKEGNELSLPRKLLKLEKDFEELKMNARESMGSYLGRAMDIVEGFSSLGNPKPDDEVITKLLTTLSRSYASSLAPLEQFMTLPDMTLNDLVSILDLFGDHPETMPDELRKFYISIKKAKSEQMWCVLCKSYDHNQEDCYPIPRDQCFQCGERGHFARDCNRRNEKPEHLMLTVTMGDFLYDEDMWMVYSTATNHMTPYLKLFTTLDRTYRARIEMANGDVIVAEGRGDVKITVKGVRKMIKNVLFVRGINRNVLSIGQLTSGGYSVVIGGDECTVRDETGKIFATNRWDERGIALRLQVIR